MTTDLLRIYDTEVRGAEPAAGAGRAVERDGPVFRTVGLGHHMIEYPDLGGLDGADLDAFIARQVAYFAARGEGFEWKTHGHDAPADLPARLLAAGFVAEPAETVVVGRAAPLAVRADPPPGVRLREVTDEVDMRRIADLTGLVWGVDRSAMVPRLLAEVALGSVVMVAEAGSEMVSQARIHFGPGRFASLWGGATRAEWRGRGIYRALVSYRARLAVDRGYEFLQVDCTEDSRPILERLGLTPITTTTPFVWTP